MLGLVVLGWSVGLSSGLVAAPPPPPPPSVAGPGEWGVKSSLCTVTKVFSAATRAGCVVLGYFSVMDSGCLFKMISHVG